MPEETISWVRSIQAPSTVPVRDDGQEALAEDQGLEAAITALQAYKAASATDRRPLLDAAKLSTTMAFGLTERPAWPADNRVHIKDMTASGDRVQIRQLSIPDRVNYGGSMTDTEVRWYLGSLCVCSVMIVRFEGEMFEDPDTCRRDEDDHPIRGTGTTITLPGDAQGNLEQLMRLPENVIEFVAGEIERRTDDPLGLRRLSSVSGSESTGHSRKSSRKARGNAI